MKHLFTITKMWFKRQQQKVWKLKWMDDFYLWWAKIVTKKDFKLEFTCAGSSKKILRENHWGAKVTQTRSQMLNFLKLKGMISHFNTHQEAGDQNGTHDVDLNVLFRTFVFVRFSGSLFPICTEFVAWEWNRRKSAEWKRLMDTILLISIPFSRCSMRFNSIKGVFDDAIER